TLSAGCAKDDVDEARKGGSSSTAQTATPPAAASQQAAPISGAPPAADATVADDGNALPLKLTGNGSAAELKRELTKLTDPAAAARFERAFRLTFTSDHAKRGYAEARDLLAGLVDTNPKFAPAYRTLGYAQFNLNPADVPQSIALYEKAIDLEPDYGEAHYAVAFLYTTVDLDKGVPHYKKAMALGVPDERNIGQRFYATKIATH